MNEQAEPSAVADKPLTDQERREGVFEQLSQARQETRTADVVSREINDIQGANLLKRFVGSSGTRICEIVTGATQWAELCSKHEPLVRNLQEATQDYVLSHDANMSKEAGQILLARFQSAVGQLVAAATGKTMDDFLENAEGGDLPRFSGRDALQILDAIDSRAKGVSRLEAIQALKGEPDPDERLVSDPYVMKKITRILSKNLPPELIDIIDVIRRAKRLD